MQILNFDCVGARFIKQSNLLATKTSTRLEQGSWDYQPQQSRSFPFRKLQFQFIYIYIYIDAKIIITCPEEQFKQSYQSAKKIGKDV